MSEESCYDYLLKALHPQGLVCPKCRSNRYRIARQNAHYPAYRCKDCDKYFTLYTGTVFAKTRQPACKLVLLLRGIAKGEASEKLSAELSIQYAWLLKLRHRIQANILSSLPKEPMEGEVFEIDELYQNSGEKRSSSP